MLSSLQLFRRLKAVAENPEIMMLRKFNTPRYMLYAKSQLENECASSLSNANIDMDVRS